MLIQGPFQTGFLFWIGTEDDWWHLITHQLWKSSIFWKKSHGVSSLPRHNMIGANASGEYWLEFINEVGLKKYIV
jgi:hypothetical protein